MGISNQDARECLEELLSKKAILKKLHEHEPFTEQMKHFVEVKPYRAHGSFETLLDDYINTVQYYPNRLPLFVIHNKQKHRVYLFHVHVILTERRDLPPKRVYFEEDECEWQYQKDEAVEIEYDIASEDICPVPKDFELWEDIPMYLKTKKKVQVMLLNESDAENPDLEGCCCEDPYTDENDYEEDEE